MEIYARCGVPEYCPVDQKQETFGSWTLQADSFTLPGRVRRGETVFTNVPRGMKLDPAQGIDDPVAPQVSDG